MLLLMLYDMTTVWSFFVVVSKSLEPDGFEEDGSFGSRGDRIEALISSFLTLEPLTVEVLVKL